MGKLALTGGTPVRTAPFPDWPIHGWEEEEALARVARSGRWGRIGGTEVAAFEEEFAAYSGARHAICVTSGTTALRIALWAAGVRSSDEVLVPPYTFLATATAVIENNGAPVFVDVDPATVNMNPDLVESAVTERTRAVLPVHFAGCAADLDRLLEFAKQRSLPLIEDASHSHGGQWNGKGLGSYGSLGCFSFQGSKNLNCGEGGAILTSDDGLAADCRAIYNYARREGLGGTEHPEMSSNYRMTEFQGAILRTQFERLPAQTATREANAEILTHRLRQIPGVNPQLRSDRETRKAYHLYLYRIDPHMWGVSKDRVVEALRAEGVPAREGYAMPVNHQRIFTGPNFGPYSGARGVDYSKPTCPEGLRACREVGWMPHTMLLAEESDMHQIADAFEKVFENRHELRTA